MGEGQKGHRQAIRHVSSVPNGCAAKDTRPVGVVKATHLCTCRPSVSHCRSLHPVLLPCNECSRYGSAGRASPSCPIALCTSPYVDKRLPYSTRPRTTMTMTMTMTAATTATAAAVINQLSNLSIHQSVSALSRPTTVACFGAAAQKAKRQ
ncbi:unnamed protein product [Periconia digitata]|uniref:Uncharacterized protein n=1 Tax=Periconia digitata TaxID=1303443 RepID=A0A9W4U380_9PLEO|nr:unnamed protein product [Periconia digitata]